MDRSDFRIHEPSAKGGNLIRASMRRCCESLILAKYRIPALSPLKHLHKGNIGYATEPQVMAYSFKRLQPQPLQIGIFAALVVNDGFI